MPLFDSLRWWAKAKRDPYQVHSKPRDLLKKKATFILFLVEFLVLSYTIVAVGSSGILKGKQKLGVTFNSDKLGSIDFTKISKLTMCSA